MRRRTTFALLASLAGCARAPSPPPAAPPPEEPAAEPETKFAPLLDIDDPAREPDVVFWPTPPSVVEKMLLAVKVTKDDLVYDLGSGDGRIVIEAARRFGARGVGYEIDAKLVEESRKKAKEAGVDHLVSFERKDIFTLDLTPATVITLYILPGMIERMLPQLARVRPGTRIISHNFPMKGVEPDQVINADEPGRAHSLLLWTAPLKLPRRAPAAAP
ncbi:MAG: class I SAM-dependent methyltransferase [Polyangiaceae bacterium]|nr:class I SAM-dependent methyltransferase [Polyangiaceae bacterium]